MSFFDYLVDHLWVPIISGIGLLIIFSVIIYWFCSTSKRRGGYDVIESGGGGMGLDEHLTRQRVKHETAERESALLNCQFYLRSSPEYKMLNHFGEIGSRNQKNWFVLAALGKPDQMMMILPRSAECSFPLHKKTRAVLKDLFVLILHPYIYPLTDVDFIVDQDQVIFIENLCVKGSLKDVLYGSNPLNEWREKYMNKGRPLNVKKIALFGRQILEAMMFLQAKGVPYGHLHSGNVMVDGDVCRITGIENALFGYRSRHHNLLKSYAKSGKETVDSICVGHVIFEMALGYELDVSKPLLDQLIGKCPKEVIEVLAFIFYNQTNTVPTLWEIAKHEFFSWVQLREIVNFSPPRVDFTSKMKELLQAASEGRPVRTRSTKKKLVETSFTGNTINGEGNNSIVSSANTTTIAAAAAAAPSTPRAASTASFYDISATSTPRPAAASASAASASTSMASSPTPSEDMGGGGRSALLGDIAKGTKLKKTKTNDRSAPKV